MTEAAKKKKVFDGRYEVLSIVGRGAASVVYHARHVGALTSEVALKVLLKQNQKDGQTKNSDLLRKEALAMVSARHKYVVRLDDFHSVGDLCYLAMEYAPFGDARKFAATKGGRLSVETGELFFSQCAEALDFVHRVGIVHRDIKPDNILIVSDKEVRLADFGVAVLPGESPSMKDLQAGVGTMSYMAPEVIEGTAYDKRSDIYSLGVAFYELFSGIHPFEKAPLIEQLAVRQDNNIPPLHVVAPDVPRHLSDVVMQAMSYNPENRFANCPDMVQALLVKKSQPAKGVAAATIEKAQSAEVVPQPPLQKPVAPEIEKQPTQKIEKQGTRPLQQKPAAPQQPDLLSKPPPAPPRSNAQKPPTPVAAPHKPVIESPSSPPPVDVEVVDEPRKPAPSKKSEQPPPAPEEMHNAVENRKPKRSLEDLRRLARETKSDTPTARAIKQEKRAASKPVEERHPQSSSVLSSLFMLLFTAAAVYTIYSYFSGKSEAPGTIIQPDATAAPAENAQPTAISFPELSNGVYHGSVRGLFVDHELPLSLISLGAERGIIVTIGLPGFTPQLVIPEGGTESLRISTNGFILDFHGITKDGAVSGEVVNIVTGEKGTWNVEGGK